MEMLHLPARPSASNVSSLWQIGGRKARQAASRLAFSVQIVCLVDRINRLPSMPLSPEQTKAVASWVAAGDSLAAIQKKLLEQFKVSMTYMDVRFLVDDLGLELKNAAQTTVDPKADLAKARPVAPTQPEKKGGLLDKLKKAVGAGGGDEALPDDSAAMPEEAGFEAGDELADAAPAGTGSVKVEIDRLVRPGAVVSGNVTFSDGTAGKWAMDQYGRLMLDTGKKGYQPSPADVQIFQRELSTQLQRHGF
jgi:transposase